MNFSQILVIIGHVEGQEIVGLEFFEITIKSSLLCIVLLFQKPWLQKSMHSSIVQTMGALTFVSTLHLKYLSAKRGLVLPEKREAQLHIKLFFLAIKGRDGAIGTCHIPMELLTFGDGI